MDGEPKGGVVPVIVAGAFMALCCAAPLLLGAAGASVLAWFGGFGIAEAGAMALLAVVVVLGLVRLRGAMRRADAPSDPPRAVK